MYITGPFKLNGCPLRRVDQAYVIATKTQVPLDDLKVPARLTDEALKREKKKKSKRAEDMFDSTREEVRHFSITLVTVLLSVASDSINQTCVFVCLPNFTHSALVQSEHVIEANLSSLDGSRVGISYQLKHTHL